MIQNFSNINKLTQMKMDTRLFELMILNLANKIIM